MQKNAMGISEIVMWLGRHIACMGCRHVVARSYHFQHLRHFIETTRSCCRVADPEGQRVNRMQDATNVQTNGFETARHMARQKCVSFAAEADSLSLQTPAVTAMPRLLPCPCNSCKEAACCHLHISPAVAAARVLSTR